MSNFNEWYGKMVSQNIGTGHKLLDPKTVQLVNVFVPLVKKIIL